MMASLHDDRLADGQYVVVCMRLLLDRQHRLVHGQIVDSEDNAGQFYRTWDDLFRALHDRALRLGERHCSQAKPDSN